MEKGVPMLRAEFICRAVGLPLRFLVMDFNFVVIVADVRFSLRFGLFAGTFSEVLTCRLADGKLAAVKRMKSEFRSWEQVNSLREVGWMSHLAVLPSMGCS
jgi:hypothetical protein